MTILTATDGSVRTITINRPQARNAVDPATSIALRAAFETGMADDAIRVVVLTGAGGAFCAGADLKAVGAGESFPAFSMASGQWGRAGRCGQSR